MADHARTDPALHHEPAAVGQRIGEQRVHRPGEGQLQLGLGAIRRETEHLAEARIQRLDVDAVPRAGDALQHHARLRHDLDRIGEARPRDLGLDDAEARRVLVGQQIEIVFPERGAGDRVLGRADLAPDRLAGRRRAQRGGVEHDLVLHALDHRAQGDVRAGLGEHDGEVDVGHGYGRIEALGEHLQVL